MNPPRTRKCQACGKARPKKRTPKHQVALLVPYDEYVALNGGEHCGVCGARRKEGAKRLHRDHEHSLHSPMYGKPRGLLCFPCNRKLEVGLTPEWLRAAADYLERAAA